MWGGGAPRWRGALDLWLGNILALPFFAYIETTAEKRPSMGSYVWGLAMLVAVGFEASHR
jgi:hypothetical protein